MFLSEIQMEMSTIGAGDMRRIMDADVGGIGYVLREGETDLPPEIQKIWDESAEIREILRKNIKPGRTARETLNLLIRKLEEAGYVYIDKDEYDRKADPEKTQVHLDLHAMGKGMLGPRISPFGPKWQGDMKIPINHCFAFEFMVHMPVPKWGKGNASEFGLLNKVKKPVRGLFLSFLIGNQSQLFFE